MDLERLEEQRGRGKCDHLRFRQSWRDSDRTNRSARDRESARVFCKSETTPDPAGRDI